MPDLTIYLQKYYAPNAIGWTKLLSIGYKINPVTRIALIFIGEYFQVQVDNIVNLNIQKQLLDCFLAKQLEKMFYTEADLLEIVKASGEFNKL